MKQYIISLVAVCVVGAVVSILSPEGEGGGIARHTRLIVGICVILVCFAPVTDAVEWVRNFDIGTVLPDYEQDASEYESIFGGSYSDAEADNLKEGIAAFLVDRFGLDPTCISVKVRLSGEGKDKRPERVTVTLYGSAIFADTHAIEDSLSSLLGCEIVTIIG